MKASCALFIGEEQARKKKEAIWGQGLVDVADGRCKSGSRKSRRIGKNVNQERPNMG